MEGIRERHPSCNVATGMGYLPNDHFGDPSHVNPRGSERLSVRLAAYLARYEDSAAESVMPLELGLRRESRTPGI